jgi:hypothetical protein
VSVYQLYNGSDRPDSDSMQRRPWGRVLPPWRQWVEVERLPERRSSSA